MAKTKGNRNQRLAAAAAAAAAAGEVNFGHDRQPWIGALGRHFLYSTV